MVVVCPPLPVLGSPVKRYRPGLTHQPTFAWSRTYKAYHTKDTLQFPSATSWTFEDTVDAHPVDIGKDTAVKRGTVTWNARFTHPNALLCASKYSLEPLGERQNVP